MIEGSNLPDKDILSLSDPYVHITTSWDNTSLRTRTVSDSLDPIWNEKFLIPVVNEDYKEGEIIVELFDSDTFKGMIR